MSHEPAWIIRHLTTQALGHERVYIGRAPGTVTPAAGYATVISLPGEHHEHMGGDSGLASVRVQLDLWDTDDERLQRSYQATRMHLSGQRGAVAIDGDTTQVRRIHLADHESSADPATDASGRPVFRMRMDFRVDYIEEVVHG